MDCPQEADFKAAVSEVLNSSGTMPEIQAKVFTLMLYLLCFQPLSSHFQQDHQLRSYAKAHSCSEFDSSDVRM